MYGAAGVTGSVLDISSAAGLVVSSVPVIAVSVLLAPFVPLDARAPLSRPDRGPRRSDKRRVSGAWHAQFVGAAIRVAGRAAGRAVGRLLDLALPATCAGCGREGDILCVPCRPALRARAHVPAGTPIGLPSETPDPLLQLEWCAPFSGRSGACSTGSSTRASFERSSRSRPPWPSAGDPSAPEATRSSTCRSTASGGASAATTRPNAWRRRPRRALGCATSPRWSGPGPPLLSTSSGVRAARANVRGAFRLVDALPPRAVAGHWFGARRRRRHDRGDPGRVRGRAPRRGALGVSAPNGRPGALSRGRASAPTTDHRGLGSRHRPEKANLGSILGTSL